MDDLPIKLTNDPAKDEILRCVLQLAKRCSELGYEDLESSLSIVVGAETYQDGEGLADMMGDHAQLYYPGILDHTQGDSHGQG